jgi:hypothetical protein
MDMDMDGMGYRVVGMYTWQHLARLVPTIPFLHEVGNLPS